MWCASCGDVGSWQPVCHRCRASYRRPEPRVLPGGLVVASLFLHEGMAKRLVHVLKFDGAEAVVDQFADGLASLVPTGATALIPIPRSFARVVRHGIDPATTICAVVSALTGVPVVHALRRPLTRRSQVGLGRGGRTAVTMRSRRLPAEGWVLIDDVVTTGSSLLSAQRALGGGGLGAVTITSAQGQMS